MSMASSSLFLSPLPKIPIVSSSLLSFPHKPRSRRKNHLRPKLPPELFTPQQQQQQQPPVLTADEAPHLITLHEEEARVESVQELGTHESQPLDSRPLPNPKSFVLDLSLRFAALLAVQTAAAVWLFSRGPKPEESAADGGVGGVEREVEGGGEGELDFEKLVLEIREMAREARAREAKEREENELKSERFLTGALNEKSSGSRKLGSMKRLGFVRSNVMRRKNAGMGFDGEKKMGEGSNASDNGGIQQIAHQNPSRESPNLHESRQSSEVLSELSTKPADVESLVLPYEKSSDVNILPTFQRSTERSKDDRGTTSLSNRKSTRREVQSNQVFKKSENPSSTKSTKINGRSNFDSQKKEPVGKSVVSKYDVDIFDQRKNPWWLKLSFVLAILLHSGSDCSSPKGLYSLKMDSPSDDGDSAFYTIVFQDQGDATNFCYLLETFFGELDDFTADVVPLTIDELEEGVNSSALKVIVVRKGQLQLYAGQPLADVETALRSLLD